MSDTTPKTAAIVELFDVDSPFAGSAVCCRIKPTGLMVTEGGRDASGRVSPDIAEAISNLALAIRLKNEGRSQAQLREANGLSNTGKLDASKITIKDEAEEAPALFTISKRDGSKVKITQTGVEVVIGDHDGTLMKHAMDALPLILERERDRQLYGPHKVISLQDAVTAIREAIEDGDDATVDAAGDAIAELVRFIGRADDRDTELVEAIAHERKRAQAEAEERGTAETITDAQSAIKAGPSCSAQDAVSGVAEGLAAAGSLGCTYHYAKAMSKAHNRAQISGEAFVRLTYGHGEGMQAELVEGMAAMPSPTTEDHDYKTTTETSVNAISGRVTETTTAIHSWTPRR